jgi:predicted DNA-binding protein YlxM (UPF0122 family)
MLNNKELILKLYFMDKLRAVDISNKLEISKSAVTQVLQQDKRYLEEKNNRKQLNKIKHNKDIQRRVEFKRRQRSNIDIQILNKMHEQASIELSGGRKPINNRAYRDWNTSAYKYNDKNKSYELRKEINAGADIPKRIKWKNF